MKWYWVSVGLLCLYILKNMEIYSDVTIAGRRRRRRRQGKIGLLSQWTMEGWDEQYLYWYWGEVPCLMWTTLRCFQELSKFNEKLHFLRVLYISICGQFCAREYLCKSDRCQNPVPKKIKARMYCVLAFNMKWWVTTQMEFLFPFLH